MVAEAPNVVAHEQVTTIAADPPGAPLRALQRLAGPPPAGFYPWLGKPLFDRAAAAGLLLAMAPILAASATMVRLTMGKGVLYRQQRVGRHGEPFTILKLRTMMPDRRMEALPFAGTERRTTHKSDDDPRHTTTGRILRKTSVDELPQLINVLRGEMSLVGPRPELTSVAQQYDLVDHPRHLVKPGITGVWQVSDAREQLLHECVDMDLDYLRSVTWKSDLSLLASTVKGVLARKGR